jgi:chromosome segregation ATPase
VGYEEIAAGWQEMDRQKTASFVAQVKTVYQQKVQTAKDAIEQRRRLDAEKVEAEAKLAALDAALSRGTAQVEQSKADMLRMQMQQKALKQMAAKVLPSTRGSTATAPHGTTG